MRPASVRWAGTSCMSESRRLFTPQEANSLLAELRPLMASLLEARHRLLQLQPSLGPILERILDNGGGRVAGQALAEFQRIRQVVETINGRGVLVKDVNAGLLDFPSEREGRLVYLCWRYDEPEIGFWHEVDSGFAGRQPL